MGSTPPVPARPRRAGVTLLEVLVAIFIAGVGLLALLTLFPVGALNMARAIQDDRAGAVVADAEAFSRTGVELVARTRQFVVVSLVNGAADPKSVAALRDDYADLLTEAAELESRIAELRQVAKTPRAKRAVDRLLALLRAIKAGLGAGDELLELLEQGP